MARAHPHPIESALVLHQQACMGRVQLLTAKSRDSSEGKPESDQGGAAVCVLLEDEGDELGAALEGGTAGR